ncbi:MAG: replicative DNA helicase [Verrucomicrobiia bacterium]
MKEQFTYEKDPLFPKDAEQAVIGCILRGPEEPQEPGKETSASDIAGKALRELSVGDFYRTGPYAMAFEIVSAIGDGEPIRFSLDYVRRFNEAWRQRFPGTPVHPDILAAPDMVPTAFAISDYVRTVKEFSRRRDAIQAIAGAVDLIRDTSRPIEQGLAELAPLLDRKTISRDTYDGREAAQELIDYLEDRWARKGEPSGLLCGLHQLDRLTDGFQFGDNHVIGARPSGGKTALGVTIAAEIGLKRKVPTLFVSLEMGVTALSRRMLCAWSEVPVTAIKRATFTEPDFVKFTAFNARLASSPLKFMDFVRGGIDSTRLCAAIRQHVRQNGTKLVIVDYLQKIRPAARHEKRTYEVAGVSEALTAVARSTGVALVTLAQLNRDSEKDSDRGPRLSDLADSSQIERDADCVILIHRPKTEKDPHGENADLIVAKQRDGETGRALVRFNGQFCRFENRPFEAAWKASD